MSKNVISLLNLLNESLLEIGDLKNIKPYTFNKIRNDKYEFTIENEDKIDVIFTRISKDLEEFIFLAPIFKKELIKDFYNLGYSIKGISTQAKKTDVKELLKVMSTLMGIVQDFLREKKLTSVLIFEENKKESLGFIKGQKSLIYKSIISQNLPNGYISGPVKYAGIEGLIISPKL